MSLGLASAPRLRAKLAQVAFFAGAFNLALIAGFWFARAGAGEAWPELWSLRGLVDVVWLAAYVSVLLIALAGRASAPLSNGLGLLLVFTDGAIGVVRYAIEADRSGLVMLGTMFVVFTVGALLLPWTPIRAAAPVAGWVVLLALALLLIEGQDPAFGELGLVVAAAAVVAPGLAATLVQTLRRQDHFTIRFFQDRLQEVRQELVDARAIHEASFPTPAEEGAVRFAYRYEPMRQIGGDYLVSHFGMTPEADRVPQGADPEHYRPLVAVVLDVTGHGIPAALTVNRLHGEIARILAEVPDIRAGRVLTLLNRYCYLTLSEHGVFVAATVVRVDPVLGELRYANAGLPHALLRTAGGVLEELAPTATILGALDPERFDAGERRLPFHPGDILLVCTDGAVEARTRGGEHFGLARVREVLVSSSSPPDGRLAAAVLRALDRFRHGPPADDTLIIELYRPRGDWGEALSAHRASERGGDRAGDRAGDRVGDRAGDRGVDRGADQGVDRVGSGVSGQAGGGGSGCGGPAAADAREAAGRGLV